MGNGSLVEAKGKGTVNVQIKERKRLVDNVLLVQSLEQNLLCSQMVQNGYSLHFDGDLCRIYENKIRLG